jgi:hypothetical protein
MPVTFPTIRPTDRRLVPGTVPQSVTRTVNGRTVRRPFASHGGGMRLEVEFVNRPDSEVEAIRQVRNAAGTDPVLLPDELWAGDPELLVFVKFLPAGTAWRFSGDVEVEWAKRGRATIKVAFVNYCRTVFTLPPPPEVEPPPVIPVTHQFLVSETTTTGATLNTGTNNYVYSQPIFTAAGSIYWTGRATVGSTARYFLMKYDSNGNQLWARWLEGNYTVAGLSEPVLCEGPAGGVFVAVTGIGTNTNPMRMGASMRIHLFTSEGALANTAAWQFANTGFGDAKYQDLPGCIFYEPTQQKLYVAGAGASFTVLRALTLDQPYGVSNTVFTQNGAKRVFWLADKQRIVIAGTDNFAGDFFIREFSPDLQTQYQAYRYTATGSAFAVDAFGSVFAGTISGTTFSLSKTSGSDGNYAPLWKRSFSLGATQSGTGARMDFFPDGRLAVLIATGGGSGGSRSMRLRVYVLSADQSAIEYFTALLWTGTYPWLPMSVGVCFDFAKELALFVTYSFTLGITSLRLPSTATNLLVGSTASGTNADKNITGVTIYTPSSLTVITPIPTKTVLSAPLTNLNPMVAWSESAWSTTDLTATVNHVTVSTGPLVVP